MSLEKFFPILKIIERFVLIFAAIAVLFPLYQWASEAPERRLDRISRLALTLPVCSNPPDFRPTIVGGTTDQYFPAPDNVLKKFPNAVVKLEWPAEHQADVWKKLCSEVANFLISETDGGQLKMQVFPDGVPE